MRGLAGGTNLSKFLRQTAFVISSARVAFAAAIMEAGTADGDRPDSSAAKAAS